MTNPTENSSENQKTKSGGQFHGCRTWFATNSASINSPCSLRIQCHTPHVSTSPSSSAAWPPVRSYCYYCNGEPELRQCHRKFFGSVHQQPRRPGYQHTELSQLRSKCVLGRQHQRMFGCLLCGSDFRIRQGCLRWLFMLSYRHHA